MTQFCEQKAYFQGVQAVLIYRRCSSQPLSLRRSAWRKQREDDGQARGSHPQPHKERLCKWHVCHSPSSVNHTQAPPSRCQIVLLLQRPWGWGAGAHSPLLSGQAARRPPAPGMCSAGPRAARNRFPAPWQDKRWAGAFRVICKNVHSPFVSLCRFFLSASSPWSLGCSGRHYLLFHHFFSYLSINTFLFPFLTLPLLLWFLRASASSRLLQWSTDHCFINPSLCRVKPQTLPPSLPKPWFFGSSSGLRVSAVTCMAGAVTPATELVSSVNCDLTSPPACPEDSSELSSPDGHIPRTHYFRKWQQYLLSRSG